MKAQGGGFRIEQKGTKETKPGESLAIPRQGLGEFFFNLVQTCTVAVATNMSAAAQRPAGEPEPGRRRPPYLFSDVKERSTQFVRAVFLRGDRSSLFDLAMAHAVGFEGMREGKLGEAFAQGVGFGDPFGEGFRTMEREDTRERGSGSRRLRKNVSTPVDS